MLNYKEIFFKRKNREQVAVLAQAKAFSTLCTYLTASFNALPGLKAGTLLAAISISSPV